MSKPDALNQLMTEVVCYQSMERYEQIKNYEGLLAKFRQTDDDLKALRTHVLEIAKELGCPGTHPGNLPNYIQSLNKKIGNLTASLTDAQNKLAEKETAQEDEDETSGVAPEKVYVIWSKTVDEQDDSAPAHNDSNRKGKLYPAFPDLERAEREVKSLNGSRARCADDWQAVPYILKG